MASLLQRLSKSSSLRREVASLLNRGLSGAGSAQRAPAVSHHRVGRRTRARLLTAALSGGQQQHHLQQPSTNGHSGAADTADQPSTSGRERLADSNGHSILLATEGEDTIASLVTGGSRSGAVDVIRVSGSSAVETVKRVFWPQGKFSFQWKPQSQRIYYGTAVDGDGQVIDEVLCLAMLKPKSYTREDVLELHTHGGGVCAQRVLRALIEAGARPARPGEFTLRAFLNGRLDLSQAENVLALVNARTAAAADSALAGLQGGLGQLVSELRADVLSIITELEARLDFDEDLPPLDVEQLKQDIADLQEDIEDALRTSRQGSLLRQGLQVAIVGRPNVGKSSLLNAWTGTNRAIVTEIAGTTRDIVEADLVVSGVAVTLLDTAGMRSSSDVVEQLGVERSAAAAAAADVVVMVVDAEQGWTDADGEIFDSLWGKEGPGSRSCKVRGPALLVANKQDLAGDRPLQLPLLAKEVFRTQVHTSAMTKEGLPQLDAALLQLAGAPQLAAGGVSWSVNERQAEALIRAHEALMAVGDSIAADMPLDCWTIDLRAALIALGEVGGEGVSEEVLGSVFSKFCIGK